MKNLFLILVFLVYSSVFSQKVFFEPVNDFRPTTKSIDYQIKSAKYYKLNISDFNHFLANFSKKGLRKSQILSLPDSRGKIRKYKVFESSVMEASLQNKYPNIRSFKGQGITNQSENIRFTIAPSGFQAVILGTSDGIEYIKPVDPINNIYSFHLRKDILQEDNMFQCNVLENSNNNYSKNSNISNNADDGILRNYRIAIAATGEFSNLFSNNLTSIISQMNNVVSNANAIFERELSLKLTMVDNTNIIFFNPSTDPFTNTNNITIIEQNQSVLDGTIGQSNYDIGHVFNTAGGGRAALASSCVNGLKGKGVSGNSNPSSSSFFSTFIHELGHQFGAGHTFNSDVGPTCIVNISPLTAVEPGSGSTIMAYPGSCAPQNVQETRDLYFNQVSLDEIWSHVQSSSGCPVNQTSTGNNAPTANAGPDYLIPQGTPYKLTGSSTDLDGTTSHTFTWEQIDTGIEGVPTETTTNGPLVRSFEGTTLPTRYIPNLDDLLISQGSSDWEKLVTVDRNIEFALTVRDNDVLGGQTAVDEMLVTVTTAAGPFKVTSQDLPNQIIWTPGTIETVTWDVAGTDGNGINEQTVNILLSTDEGITFDTVLASNVPNTGSYNINVPNIDAAKCRLMVEASNNIFFNINSEFFAIGNYTYGDLCQDYTFDINEVISQGNSLTFYDLEILDDITISDFNINVNITGNAPNNSFFIVFKPPFENSTTQIYSLDCPGTFNLDVTFDDEGDPINCNSTFNGDNVLPDNPLSFVDNQSSEGTWLLGITDFFSNSLTSTLNTVTLNICELGAVPNLSVDEINLVPNFILYPNPSNGKFRLKVNNALASNFIIEVHDITGRNIYNKTIKNNDISLDHQIDLGNVSSGTYIIKLIQGNYIKTEKLIVK